MNSLRVWHVQNIPNKPDFYLVSCVEEAMALIDVLINNDLVDSSIESNALGLEDYDGEFLWTEYYNEDGQDIKELMKESGYED